MKPVWITSGAEFQAIADKWDSAVRASGQDNPFLLSIFILTWWRYYRRGRALSIFAVFDGDRIIGGLPLYLERALGIRALMYPGHSAANYTDFFCTEKDVDLLDLFTKALAAAPRWDIVSLTRSRVGTAEIGDGDTVNGIRLAVADSIESCLTDIPDDMDDFIAARPKKLRYYLRRGKKRLTALGRLAIEPHTDEIAVRRLYGQFTEMAIRSFRKRGKKSAFENKQFRSFFESLLLAFHGIGLLEANALTHNGRVIAVHFGYTIQNNVNFVLTTFELDYAENNPGHLLIDALIRSGIERGARDFDMYYGDVLYKKQWATRFITLSHLEMWRTGSWFRHRLARGLVRAAPGLVRLRYFVSLP